MTIGKGCCYGNDPKFFEELKAINSRAEGKSEKMKKVTYLGSSPAVPGKTDFAIYTVSSVHELYVRGAGSYPRSRCWGYFLTLEEAQEAVKVNAGDMAERCYYTHVVIEKIAPGIPGGAFSDLDAVIWYQWQRNPQDESWFEGAWIPVDRPEWSLGTIMYCGL